MGFYFNTIRNSARLRWTDCLCNWNRCVPIGVLLLKALLAPASQARRHKTKLHSSSANSLYAKPSWAITLASELHCVRQGVPKRPLAILPERRPIVTPDMGRPPAGFWVRSPASFCGMVAPSSNYFARACALQQRYSKTCLYAFPDPTNGSPRQNTGTEEVTPREARFHVVPSSGFMFSLCMHMMQCNPLKMG